MVGCVTQTSTPLSILDLAAVGREETIAESFAGSVELARAAESSGYRRIWYAEHHNISSIASSATAVLIAHVAAHTESIRLGAGGVMLPNHSPLVIAEQFGTLETLHPGRIDLGLGRAPGTDQNTFRALRRDPAASERFPQDVRRAAGPARRREPAPGSAGDPRAGHPRPALHPRLVAVRRPARRASSDFPTPSPPTSRRGSCIRRSPSTARSSGHPRS